MAVSARDATATARRLAASQPASSQPEDQIAPRPRLDVVERRRSESRSLRRQAKVLRALGVAFVVGALAVTAAAHTFVASDQQRIDALQTQLTETVAQQQDLQISRAELEAPVRVLNIAEHELGMVAPGSVSYLAPVNPGPSVRQSGAAAESAGARAGVKSPDRSARTGGRHSSATSQPG
jgi:cell division protein FtsB